MTNTNHFLISSQEGICQPTFWKCFQRLLPDSPTIVATVVAVAPASGFSTVQTPSGGIVRVKGTGVPAGGKCYIKDGVIQGPAPDLPHYELEV